MLHSLSICLNEQVNNETSLPLQTFSFILKHNTTTPLEQLTEKSTIVKQLHSYLMMTIRSKLVVVMTFVKECQHSTPTVYEHNKLHLKDCPHKSKSNLKGQAKTKMLNSNVTCTVAYSKDELHSHPFR
jgi:hypothetical protein